MYWSKRIRNDMKLAADLKAMNRTKVWDCDIPVYEERDTIDRMTGEHRKVRVQIGTRPGKVTFPAIPRRELHRFAMGGGR